MALIQNGNQKRVAAIISEYNPFHNGHKYHIEATRRGGADFIISVMSGNTVQRGETAIFDKHFRAMTAVQNGCDLVIELPYPFSSSSAKDFACGAVSIIGRLGIVDILSFGCECDDIELLEETAKACCELSDNDTVSSYIREGLSYPAALSRVMKEAYPAALSDCLSMPNNTLAIEYICALQRHCPDIELMPVKRIGTNHDSDEITETIASASQIRKMIRCGEDVSSLIPYDISKIPAGDIDSISDMIFLVLLSDEDALKNCPLDLATRIKSSLMNGQVTTFSSLVDAVKSKNYTRARISREILGAFIASASKIVASSEKPYARILAFNENGRILLREIENNSHDIFISSSLSELEKNSPELAGLDSFTSRIQSLSSGRGISNEYTRKFEGFIKG